jgi:lysophospholipase L1-like esterase
MFTKKCHPFTRKAINIMTRMKPCIFSLYVLLFSFPLFGQQVTIEGEVSMLALGDSYTIGESVDVQDRWPHQFITYLRSRGVSAEFPDYLATTGWTTRNLLNSMQTQLPGDRPYNLVSILIGVNNQYQGLDIAIYEPDLRNIIDQALEIVDGDSSRLLILSIPDYAYTPFGDGDPDISQEIDAYNEIKRRVADEYGITFIDITEISREGLNNPSLVASDGLHPSKDQYALWVQAIMPRLNVVRPLTAGEPGYPDRAVLHLYPNPAGSRIYMNSSRDIGRISIYNPMGQLVLDHPVTSLPASVDLTPLGGGVYTLCAHQQDVPRRHCRTFVIKN